jgi:DNA-binding NtrC family response regulator
MSSPDAPGDFAGDPATVAMPAVRRLPPGGGALYVLTVVAGPDAGRRITVDESTPTLLVGASPACALQLTDRSVSRRHAAFEWTEGALRVTDVGSTNGTFVRDLRVGDAFLEGGESVRLGETEVAVTRAGAATAAAPPATDRFGRLVGESPELRRLYPMLHRLAVTEVPVIIEGETGTGKELLAEAIHESGPRANRPFVVFDCTAVPPTLAEAALFGHERGAFTGATQTRRGVFEEASGGTLLIDEIGDLDPGLQPKLLRVLERRQVRRLGGDRPVPVDVRLMAATRRDLDKEVQAGRFRDDLFFRLAVARVELPPLRRRRGDVTVLARHFWSELGGADAPPAALLARLEAYPWPGNVRELRNAIARHLALGELGGGETLAGAPAPSMAEAGADWVELVLAQDLPLPRARQLVVDEFQRRYVARVLARHGGNVSRAAASSGIARRYFQILKARAGGEP